MATQAPAVRKHLSADALFGRLRPALRHSPIIARAHPRFHCRTRSCPPLPCSPSNRPLCWPLTKSATRAICNGSTASGRCPVIPRMREILDPVEPESLRPLFKSVFRALQRGKALEEMVFVDGHYLLALDGTGYFSSQEIHCDSCLERHHRNGTVTYSHQMLGAALIHPDRREVIPLMPEPIIKQDGTEKNDCERNAAKRFIVQTAPGPPPPQADRHRRQPEFQCPSYSHVDRSRSAITFWGSKKATMPFCSSTWRRPSKRDA